MQKLSPETKIEQLLACEQLLKAARQENDAFINIAAHDLKAPLRKLSILIERLLLKATKAGNDDLLIYSNKIAATLGEMNLIIERLSAYTAVVDSDIKFSETDLTALVTEVIVEQSQVIKDIKRLVVVEQLPILKINKGQIKMVFKELFDNAFKFIRADILPEIKIISSILTLKEKEIYNLAFENNYHKIEFIDNGIGITKEITEKIFQPFYRFYGKATFEGSGMGLAIARKIMKNHQGHIYAMPGENAGVIIVIIFPEIF